MTRVEKKPRFAVRAIAILSVSVPLASCLNTVDNNQNYYQYGAITVQGLGGSAQVRATSNAVFFEALSANVPDSRLVQNTCSIVAVDTTTPVYQGDLRAGAAITLQSGAGDGKLTTTLPFNSASVSYLSASGFTYQSGDSVFASVPGEAGGFPAGNISVRLAEPIIPDDITVPAANVDMNVSWNVGDSTSAVILAIRYANPSSSTYANEQVLCSLVDDGNEAISSSVLGPFLLSPVAKRSVVFTRWRTNALQPGTRSLLHIVSTVDSTAKLK